MSVQNAIKDCLEVAKGCKTQNGFYVLSPEMLGTLIKLGYNAGERAGIADTNDRINGQIEKIIGKP